MPVHPSSSSAYSLAFLEPVSDSSAGMPSDEHAVGYAWLKAGQSVLSLLYRKMPASTLPSSAPSVSRTPC